MEVVPNMPADHLSGRAEVLSSSLRNIEHCEERKRQIQKELSVIAFEQYSQYQEEKI